MTVKERIAYVRGLIAGSDIPANGNDALRTIWENLLLVCDGLADSIGALERSHEEMEQYVEAIDLDLCELEEDLYEYEDEDLDELQDGLDVYDGVERPSVT